MRLTNELLQHLWQSTVKNCFGVPCAFDPWHCRGVYREKYGLDSRTLERRTCGKRTARQEFCLHATRKTTDVHDATGQIFLLDALFHSPNHPVNQAISNSLNLVPGCNCPAKLGISSYLRSEAAATACCCHTSRPTPPPLLGGPPERVEIVLFDVAADSALPRDEIRHAAVLTD